MKEKWEEVGATKSLAPKSFINYQDICYSVAWDYIVSQLCKITKIYELATMT